MHVLIYLFLYVSTYYIYIYLCMTHICTYTCWIVTYIYVIPFQFAGSFPAAAIDRGKAADNSEWPCRSLAAPPAYTGGILALPRMIPNLPKLRFQCAKLLYTIRFGGSFPILDRRILGGTDVFLNRRGTYFDMGGWNVGNIILPTLRGSGKWTVRSIYSAITGSINLELYFLWLVDPLRPQSTVAVLTVVEKYCVCLWFLQGLWNWRSCHAAQKTAVVCSNFGSFPSFHCFSGVCMDVSISFWELLKWNPESVLASLFSWWFQTWFVLISIFLDGNHPWLSHVFSYWHYQPVIGR